MSKKLDPNHPFAALAALKKKAEEAEKSQPPKPSSPPREVRRDRAHTPEEQKVEDELAFHRMISGVSPIDRSKGRVALEKPRALSTKRIEQDAEEAHDRLRSLVEGGSSFELHDDGRRAEGRRTEVPHEQLRKLRRGMFPVDVRLDLHGRTVEEAKGELARFLSAAHAAREKCALVVFGKGLHSPGGQGILRGEMVAWVTQGASSRCVAAFATAQEESGGDGAMYVLLRK